MMTDQKPDQEKEATPKGAVEVDEKDLDKASGGAAVDYFKPPAGTLTSPDLKDPTGTLTSPDLKDPSLNYSPTPSGDSSIIGEKG
jgi:hypothetical protein